MQSALTLQPQHTWNYGEQLRILKGSAYGWICSAPHIQPQSKGKIERFFRTVRAQLLTRLNDEDHSSLAALNRRLAAWVEGEYHHSPHRGIEGDTPLERWARVADAVRYPEPDMDLDDLFLFEEQRKVQNDRIVCALTATARKFLVIV